MAGSEIVIASRYANALFSEASVSQNVLERSAHFAVYAPGNWFLFKPLKIIFTKVLEWIKEIQGGLWVGGKAVLSSRTLTFTANSMNEAMHDPTNELSTSIPLSDVVTVRVRSAFITDIVEIEAASGALSLRCFRAKAFAAEIDNASLLIREGERA